IDIARNSNYQPTFQNVNSVNAADDISPDDDSISIAKKVLQANIYSLSNATQFLTKELFDYVLALMYSAKTLHLFGQGGSS
ncbi:MurR/RpiR family transcriptional regulator, partial [Enterococcus faecalis]